MANITTTERNPMRLSIPLTITLGAILVAAACGGQAAPPPVPTIDSTGIRDSIARAEAARRATADSIQRAREEAERIAAARRADSLAAIARVTEGVRTMMAARIHFDFNKSNIRPGADAMALDQKIAILQANSSLRIRITGHCDERGSDEYNMALGNRRALSAKEYMVSRGIAADRITTASRGEEAPMDAGHNEDAWTQNRRDQFEITGGGQQLRAPQGM
jgi:peptidoglycan-associated lipoprotein